MVAPGRLGRVWEQEEGRDCSHLVIVAPGRERVWEREEESGMSLKPHGGCLVVIAPGRWLSSNSGIDEAKLCVRIVCSHPYSIP